MKVLVALLSVCFSAMAYAQPKIALVRINDIYMSLPSTRATHDRLFKERQAIVDNERHAQLMKKLGEMEELNKQIQRRLSNLNTEEGVKLTREFELKRQETFTLRTEFEKYRAAEESRINKEVVAATRASLKRITDTAEQLAKERNIDLILDSSAVSNTGEKLLLYTSNTNDITDDVVALLGEKEPEKETSPEPTPPTPAPENP